MSMYNEYLKEKYHNRQTIETDHWFIDYEVFNDNSIFVWILYSDKTTRGAGHGYELEQLMINKEKPISITCQVDLECKNSELSLRRILGVGYKIENVTPTLITLRKVCDAK